MRFKSIILFMAALCICSAAFSQDNKAAGQGQKVAKAPQYKVSATIKSARTLIKAANYSKANDEIAKAFKQHKEAKQNTTLHNLQLNCLYQMALAENKKMYLNNKTDTATYFSYIYSMYACALDCDSLESIPNEKGKVDYHYRDSHAAKLIEFRKNLGMSGRFFYRKKDYANAYKYFDYYYTTKSSPILNKGKYRITDENDSVEYAYLCAVSAFGAKKYDGVKRYIDVAVMDTTLRAQLMEIGVKSYFALNDTISAMKMLKEGFSLYPETEFFYMSLVNSYNEKGKYSRSLQFTDSLLSKVKPNRNLYYIRGKVQDMLAQPDSALVSYQKAIELKGDDAESYAAIGNIYLSKGQAAYQSFNLPLSHPKYSKQRSAIMDIFKKAQSAFESARQLQPSATALWKNGLRDVYYRLNLGKQLQELEGMK